MTTPQLQAVEKLPKYFTPHAPISLPDFLAGRIALLYRPALIYPLPGRHPITNPWMAEGPYKTHWLEMPDGDIQEAPLHWGVDYGETGYSTDVLASFSGRIYRAGQSPHAGRGIEIVLDYDDGASFASYCHLSEVYVVAGDRVLAGQPLGRTGDTGFTQGFHLHFAIGAFVGGRVIWRDPLR